MNEAPTKALSRPPGASGLHILLPLGARYTHEQSKNFARLLAILGTESVPDISTIARPIAARGGKVYIDFGQNGYGVTIAGPLRPGRKLERRSLVHSHGRGKRTPASVAFHNQDIPARFQKMKDPMAPVFRKAIDLASALSGSKKCSKPAEDSRQRSRIAQRKPDAGDLHPNLTSPLSDDIVTGGMMMSEEVRPSSR